MCARELAWLRRDSQATSQVQYVSANSIYNRYSRYSEPNIRRPNVECVDIKIRIWCCSVQRQCRVVAKNWAYFFGREKSSWEEKKFELSHDEEEEKLTKTYNKRTPIRSSLKRVSFSWTHGEFSLSPIKSIGLASGNFFSSFFGFRWSNSGHRN